QLAEALPESLRKEGEKHAEQGNKEGDGHDHHGRWDPHVWLGIPQAIRMVEQIRDDLKKVDGDHADHYDKNAADYIASLKELQAYGKKELAKLKDVPVITFHESMDYFAAS